MNGAEFQCAREYLGLPAVWVGEKMHVDRRTIYRWEQGKTKLPKQAGDMMNRWLVNTAQAVAMVTLKALEDVDAPLLATPDEFEWMAVEGFPASWQRMLCARVAERTGRGIEWMQPGEMGRETA